MKASTMRAGTLQRSIFVAAAAEIEL